MTLVVTLRVNPLQLDRFRAFERKAAEIMKHYGGSIERALYSWENATEVHIVKFPSAEAFASYLADDYLQALAVDRDAFVESTTVLVCNQEVEY